jgi:hypothetical protein
MYISFLLVVPDARMISIAMVPADISEVRTKYEVHDFYFIQKLGINP